ncbi:ABC transporter substrate-binding protein [Paenarthrobacter sp. NyZ202]|uniref:ABC transporter substrate-binding protein n=1 Tax=Paenarthrobacter sp. NyZ202 TaxID=3402689 RepID=UPI003CF65F52
MLIVAAAVTIGLAMSGCGSSSPSGGTANQTVGGAITYSFWGNPARAEKVNKVIGLFQTQEPSATVTPEVADYNSYIERLTVRAAGGQLPCVLGTQSTFYSTYASKHILMPLDDLIKSGQIDTSNIPQTILEAGKVDGKQYMIPTGTFSRLMGYNADLVKASGVKPPTNDMTWKEYADWLKELQPHLPAGVKASEIEGPIMFSFTSWVIAHGQEMFKEGKLGFSKELMQEWFQYWIDLTKAGVTTPPANIPDQTAVLELSPMALGNAVAGTRDIPNFAVIQKTLQGANKPSTIELISLPAEESNKSANVLGANGLSIPANCNNVATAASFINYFTNSPEAATAFQSDNGIVTNTKSQESLVGNKDIPDAVKKNISVFQKLTSTNDLTTSTYPDGYQSLATELSRQYQAAAFGQLSVADAVDQFFNKAATTLK